MLVLIAILVAGTIFVLLLLIYQHLTKDARAVNNRLKRYAELRQPIRPVPAETEALSSGHSGMKAWRILVRKLSRYLESPQWSREMEHKLVQAGLPLRASEFLVICLGIAFLGAALLYVSGGGKVLQALLGGVGGFLLPILMLRLKIARRLKAFNLQLGDALVLIANSLRTGYSFMQAIDMVSREMAPPIAFEFGRAMKEMNLGVTTEDALNNMAGRVNSDNLDLVITAVLIQRQVGGNLAEVLDNISGTIRERIKIKAEIKTLTAQGRMSGIIISLLPVFVGIGIAVINPEYIAVFFTHPVGKMMLVGAIISQLFGIMLVRNIVNIDV